MSKTLRQRIRAVKISCHPWKHYKGEIESLCISAQCLFSNKGLPWDILEMELKDEGWLADYENLWEVLKDEYILKRTYHGDHGLNDPFDDTWTDEDYEYFYTNL